MSVDVKDLEAELVRTRRKLNDWSATRTQFATERKDHHAAFLRDQTDKLNHLQTLQTQLKIAAEQNSKRLAFEDEEVKRTEERLTVANNEVSTSERRLDASQAQLRKRQEEYRQRVEELENDQKERQMQLEALRKKSGLFSERFGLQFRNGQGELAVVMTHIDPQDHDREFCVAVRMDTNDVYTVTKCEPLVPDLEALISEVNKTNDFAAFVKAVRARFVTIARGS